MFFKIKAKIFNLTVYIFEIIDIPLLWFSMQLYKLICLFKARDIDDYNSLTCMRSWCNRDEYKSTVLLVRLLIFAITILFIVFKLDNMHKI